MCNGKCYDEQSSKFVSISENIVDMLIPAKVTRNGNTKICDCVNNRQMVITKFVL